MKKPNAPFTIPSAVRDLLVQAAREAAQGAYIPYSNYPVGAAVLAEDGQVYTGCNIENASYGLTMCAERVAIFNAARCGCRAFAAIAVAGGSGARPASPCGACRQVLAEFAAAQTPVFIAPLKKGGRVTATTLGALLPMAFRK